MSECQLSAYGIFWSVWYIVLCRSRAVVKLIFSWFGNISRDRTCTNSKLCHLHLTLISDFVFFFFVYRIHVSTKKLTVRLVTTLRAYYASQWRTMKARWVFNRGQTKENKKSSLKIRFFLPELKAVNFLMESVYDLKKKKFQEPLGDSVFLMLHVQTINTDTQLWSVSTNFTLKKN